MKTKGQREHQLKIDLIHNMYSPKKLKNKKIKKNDCYDRNTEKFLHRFPVNPKTPIDFALLLRE